MNRQQIEFFIFLIEIVVFYAIHILWQILEKIFYGKIQPSWPDTIIFLIMAISIHYNIKNYIYKAVKHHE